MSPFIKIIALGALLFPTLAIADRGGAYCGSGAQPPHDDCVAAINKIDGNQGYQSASFMAGSCTVAVNGIGAGDFASPINGNDFRAEAWGIMNSCGTSGWCTDSGLNVTVQQCIDCMYGVCSVCTAPYRAAKKRSTPTRLDSEGSLEKRLGAPGVTCQSAIAVESQECYDLASTLSQQTISLPYTAANGNCELAIEGHSGGETVLGSMVMAQMYSDIQACEAEGKIGSIVDVTSQPYTIFFGNLCNQFGFGTANCCPMC